MKVTLTALIVGAGMISVGVAHADCAADLAAMEQAASGGGGIPRDGTLAPLQETSEPAAPAAEGAEGTSQDAGEIAKDGTTAPLQEAGRESEPAMSGQDVQAQQEGEPVAAQKAEQGDEGHSEALKQARAALEKGDEAACLEALDEAKP